MSRWRNAGWLIEDTAGARTGHGQGGREGGRDGEHLGYSLLRTAEVQKDH